MVGLNKIVRAHDRRKEARRHGAAAQPATDAECAGAARDHPWGPFEAMRMDRILPYLFITAARYAPDFEPELETAMLQSLKILSGFPAARGS
jgi:hypothetical protein